jgi:hypothetical protein
VSAILLRSISSTGAAVGRPCADSTVTVRESASSRWKPSASMPMGGEDVAKDFMRSSTVRPLRSSALPRVAASSPAAGAVAAAAAAAPAPPTCTKQKP